MRHHRVLKGVGGVFLLAVSVLCADENGILTQGELAQSVCLISGLAEDMPQPLSAETAARALDQKGWSPLGGWRLGEKATRNDFHVVLAKCLGLKVSGPDREAAYSEALAAEGLLPETAAAEADPAPPRSGRAGKKHFLTREDICEFLACLGAGGLCELHVTPIGR